ncbi:homeobox SIX4-like protein [Labeo rohita]|nr:homeobox SIX4-like protein [Labeo rohita]
MSTCADGTAGNAVVPICSGALEAGVIVQQVGDSRNSVSPASVIFNGVSVNTPASVFHNGTTSFLSSTGHVLFSGMNLGLQSLACRSDDGAGQDKATMLYPSFHCTVNGTNIEVKAEDVRQDVSVQDQNTSVNSAFNVTPSDGLQLEGYSLVSEGNGTSLLSNKVVLPSLQLSSSSSPSPVTQGIVDGSSPAPGSLCHNQVEEQDRLQLTSLEPSTALYGLGSVHTLSAVKKEPLETGGYLYHLGYSPDPTHSSPTSLNTTMTTTQQDYTTLTVSTPLLAQTDLTGEFRGHDAQMTSNLNGDFLCAVSEGGKGEMRELEDEGEKQLTKLKTVHIEEEMTDL